MEELTFELPVKYKGKDQLFEAALKQYGYTYKIEVNIQGLLVQFEPDEEQSFRALITEEQDMKNKQPDRELLQAIGEAISRVLK